MIPAILILLLSLLLLFVTPVVVTASSSSKNNYFKTTSSTTTTTEGETFVQQQTLAEKDEEMTKSKSNTIIAPPVIDLSNPNDDILAKEIATACSTYGFFQIINHGISINLINKFRSQCFMYFYLSQSIKNNMRRNSYNARGYFDNEYTKQKIDCKECLDAGIPGSRNWNISDNDPSNGKRM